MNGLDQERGPVYRLDISAVSPVSSSVSTIASVSAGHDRANEEAGEESCHLKSDRTESLTLQSHLATRNEVVKLALWGLTLLSTHEPLLTKLSVHADETRVNLRSN